MSWGTGRTGRRTVPRTRLQPGSLFAPVRQRVLVLQQAGHDSAPARLHSRAQLLCITCAGGFNRGQPILRRRSLHRCGGADDNQQSQTLHCKPRFRIPTEIVRHKLSGLWRKSSFERVRLQSCRRAAIRTFSYHARGAGSARVETVPEYTNFSAGVSAKFPIGSRPQASPVFGAAGMG